MALLSVGFGAVLFAPNRRFMTLLAYRGSKTTKGRVMWHSNKEAVFVE
jgi:hypothetical protein